MKQKTYLDSVIVGIRNDDVPLRVDSHAARLGELSLDDAELAELAVVDHLLALDLRSTEMAIFANLLIF